ncbi:MAG: DNA polymerase III subunit beta [Oscillospiraceae bacterium]|jgi:DNA polymerase-3 subunit beta|nr:DNA polymerase III subunit beta [Oscillospiraceae bacterium]
MRFRCQTKQLQEAIAIAVKAVSARPSTPILEGLLIESDENGIKLTGSDELTTITTSIDASILEEGRLALPGRLLSDVIRKLPDADVELRFDENDPSRKASLRCLGSRTMLTGLNADDYPVRQEVEEKVGFTAPQEGLRTLIQRTLFSVATDESRPILTGASLEVGEDGLTMAALDGFRLAIAHMDAPESERMGCSPVQVVIPGKVLGELQHILSGDEEPAEISISDRFIRFRVGRTQIDARLLEGEFMKYRQILPTDWQTRIVAPIPALAEALDRASLIARVSKNNLVKLTINEDQLTVSSNAEQNQSQEEVEGVSTEGKPLEIAFNERYLNDILKVLDDDEIEVRFQTNVSPCILKPLEGDEYLYLVLPIRVYLAPAR